MKTSALVLSLLMATTNAISLHNMEAAEDCEPTCEPAATCDDEHKAVHHAKVEAHHAAAVEKAKVVVKKHAPEHLKVKVDHHPKPAAKDTEKAEAKKGKHEAKKAAVVEKAKTAHHEEHKVAAKVEDDKKKVEHHAKKHEKAKVVAKKAVDHATHLKKVADVEHKKLEDLHKEAHKPEATPEVKAKHEDQKHVAAKAKKESDVADEKAKTATHKAAKAGEKLAAVKSKAASDEHAHKAVKEEAHKADAKVKVEKTKAKADDDVAKKEAKAHTAKKVVHDAKK